MTTPREWALRFDDKIIGQHLNAAQLELLANMFYLAIEAAKESKAKEEQEAIAQRAEEKAKEIEPDSYDRDYAENDSAGFNADRQTARTLREFAQQIRARS